MPVTPPKDWIAAVEHHIDVLTGDGTAAPMARANAEMVRRVMRGMGPESVTPDPNLGARMAVNIAAVHVPAFCDDPNASAYKNTYDLGKTAPIGSGSPSEPVPVRALVDSVLTGLTGAPLPEEIYFGALELNGAGVRFYGDFCFILHSSATAQDPVVLSSNSYDLIRPPITPAGSKPDPSSLATAAHDMAGSWSTDSPEMAVLKTLSRRPATERRLTTGQVSEAVLEDEDYIEILKKGSFCARDLQEVRLSAADTAAETQIGEQLRAGPCPTLVELQWRKHRRAAVKALRRWAGDPRGITVRIVTSAGRLRG
jgi:hypothetical protein